MEEIGIGQIDDGETVRVSRDDDPDFTIVGFDKHRRISTMGLRK